MNPRRGEHPDNTLLVAVAIVLEELIPRRCATGPELRRVLRRSIQKSDYWLEDAVSVLFLLGVIDYHKPSGLFVMVG